MLNMLGMTPSLTPGGQKKFNLPSVQVIKVNMDLKQVNCDAKCVNNWIDFG